MAGMESSCMAAIHALVGDSDQPLPRPSERHPYFKRPGRGHNRDSCDACGECGDILCCDTCPASFHWDCSDPPLDEDEIPSGAWQCRSCKFLKADGVEWIEREEAVSGLNGHVEESDELEERRIAASIRNVFAQLLPQTNLLNPLQFVLPTDYPAFDHSLPGSSRATLRRPVANSKSKVNLAEPECAKHTKSATICFVCDVSRRVSPLLKCDSCSKHFHLDCLDPPMTTVPAGIWLCPLHPQQMLERKTLTSSCLSERVRIWEETHRPVDPFSTTLKFLNKVHRASSGFSRKVPYRTQGRVKVPEAVKMSYMYSRQQPSHSDPLIHQSAAKPSDVETEKRSSTESIPESDSASSFLNLALLADAASANSNASLLDDLLKGLHPNTIKLLAIQKLYEQNPRALQNPDMVPRDASGAENAGAEWRSGSGSVSKPSLTFLCVNDGTQLEFLGSPIRLGRGREAALDLSLHSACTRIGNRHALVYYDRVCMRWELLNYSSNGTWVNNVLYGCSLLRFSKPNPSLSAHNQALKDFRTIVHKRRKLMANQKPSSKAHTLLGPKDPDCVCLKRRPCLPTDCWEGPAALEVGDRIQLGCVKLIVMGGGRS